MTLPVRYRPAAPIQGAAYGVFFKGILTALCCVLTVSFLKVYSSGGLGAQGASQVSGGVIWFAAALCIVWLYYIFLITSQIKLDENALEQSWIWQKRVELNQLVYAKMMRINHFDWLFAPRLYVQTAAGKRLFFYCADPAVRAELEALAKAYSTPM